MGCLATCECAGTPSSVCVSICGGQGGSSGSGQGGSSGSGQGGSGQGGSSGGGDIQCGNNDCFDTNIIGVGMLSACCAAGGARCGLDADPLFAGAGCIELDAPGNIDQSCPTLNVGMGIPPQPGCCLPGGTCGYYVNAITANFGCQDPSLYGLPSGQSCNP